MKSEKGLNTPDFTEFLTKLSILEGLSKKQLSRLLDNGYKITADRGEFLFYENHRADCVFLIKSGSVKLVTYDLQGREEIVAIFSDGDLIWESVFLEEATFPFSCRCITPVTCARISNADFEIVAEDPGTAMHSIRLLSKKLHDANQRNRILSSPDPKVKLARYLIYRQERDVRHVLTITLDDLAASIAIRPETASRKLRELINMGIIRKKGQSSFIILDYAALQEIAEA